MGSFEEQFVHEFYMGKNNKGEYIDDRTRMASFCYEAGAQSKQAEVDELKREMTNKTNEAYADGQKSMRKMIKSNEDELREMVRRLVDNTIVAVDDDLENQANDLLKGDSHES